MFIRTAAAGATNTCIEWSGRDYINFTSEGNGATFTRFGVDVSAGISSIDQGVFDYTQQIQCDDSEYITDEVGNVYYLVVQYTYSSSARPARS